VVGFGKGVAIFGTCGPARDRLPYAQEFGCFLKQQYLKSELRPTAVGLQSEALVSGFRPGSLVWLAPAEIPAPDYAHVQRGNAAGSPDPATATTEGLPKTRYGWQSVPKTRLIRAKTLPPSKNGDKSPHCKGRFQREDVPFVPPLWVIRFMLHFSNSTAEAREGVLRWATDRVPLPRATLTQRLPLESTMAVRRRCTVAILGALLATAGSQMRASFHATAADPGGTVIQVAPGGTGQAHTPIFLEVTGAPPSFPAVPEPSLSPINSETMGGLNLRQIDFPSALRIAGAQNPAIGIANQRIIEAYAQLRGAEYLWLPAIRAGMSYNKHTGPLQATEGAVFNVDRNSLQPGLGVGAVGAGSPAVPGVFASFRTADAVFQPRILEHTTAARNDAARATAHDTLLATGLAYIDLLRAYQLQAIARETLDHAQQLADLTANFARAGQGTQADADRARAELMVRYNELERTNEATQVASARLIEVLNIDPGQLLAPCEPTIVPVDLVAREKPVQELLAAGLRNRPELAESQQLVFEAINRMKREQYAPLLPSMLLGISYGDFGGGLGSHIADMSGRFDLDALLYWEVRGLGVGEAVARKGTRALADEAQCRKVQVMDRVAREVAEAYAQVRTRQRQIAISQLGIQAATDSFLRNYQRIREGQGLPIEVLQAIQALDQARREYLRSVADYDEAQFRLYRAIGCALGDAPVALSVPVGP
jgi:outer membrane protein TolC